MRIALFGGTFDPPHLGHLAVAEAAVLDFKLDCILFAPTGVQPLKLQANTTPFADRLEMVKAMCQPFDRFLASDVDAPRSDGLPNYTVDTLLRLRASYPTDQLYNIVGADSFLSLGEWKDPERLLELAEWIVASRPGYDLVRGMAIHGRQLSTDQMSRVHLLSDVHVNVSATELRERLSRGEDCSQLIDERTAAYIRTHRLYRRNATCAQK